MHRLTTTMLRLFGDAASGDEQEQPTEVGGLLPCPSCPPEAMALTPTHGSTACAACGRAVHPDQAAVAYRAASDIYRFGVQYRDYYERQVVEDDTIRKAACIGPPMDVAVWLGLAAASGIVGGLAYDTVKIALRNLAALIRSKKGELAGTGKASRALKLAADADGPMVDFTAEYLRFRRSRWRLLLYLEQSQPEEALRELKDIGPRGVFRKTMMEAAPWDDMVAWRTAMDQEEEALLLWTDWVEQLSRMEEL